LLSTGSVVKPIDELAKSRAPVRVPKAKPEAPVSATEPKEQDSPEVANPNEGKEPEVEEPKGGTPEGERATPEEVVSFVIPKDRGAPRATPEEVVSFVIPKDRGAPTDKGAEPEVVAESIVIPNDNGAPNVEETAPVAEGEIPNENDGLEEGAPGAFGALESGLSVSHAAHFVKVFLFGTSQDLHVHTSFGTRAKKAFTKPPG